MKEDNKKKGWVRIYRSIKDHWLYSRKPFCWLAAFIDLILTANFDHKKFLLGGQLMECGRGEIITSINKLMTRWGWSKSQVRNFLFTLENDAIISTKRDHRKTVIKLHQYSLYQDTETTKEPVKDQQKTTERPLKDPNNNIKNINNNKEERGASPRTPDLQEIILYFKNQGIEEKEAKKFYESYESNGWLKSNGLKVANWKSCANLWILRIDDFKTDKKKPTFQQNHLTIGATVLDDKQYSEEDYEKERFEKLNNPDGWFMFAHEKVDKSKDYYGLDKPTYDKYIPMLREWEELKKKFGEKNDQNNNIER